MEEKREGGQSGESRAAERTRDWHMDNGQQPSKGAVD